MTIPPLPRRFVYGSEDHQAAGIKPDQHPSDGPLTSTTGAIMRFLQTLDITSPSVMLQPVPGDRSQVVIKGFIGSRAFEHAEYFRRSSVEAEALAWAKRVMYSREGLGNG